MSFLKYKGQPDTYKEWKARKRNRIIASSLISTVIVLMFITLQIFKPSIVFFILKLIALIMVLSMIIAIIAFPIYCLITDIMNR